PVQGRVGVSAGRQVAIKRGLTVEPWVSVAWVGALGKGADVKVNQHHFASDLPGDRVEAGMGASFSLGGGHVLTAGAEYARGSRSVQPWSATLGYRYNF
ncbi:autotransporter outer membrane beta-barrel domain-containing protein, partial [Erwinia sp. Eh17-17]|uniref:autotransporter outer membrane beta-barrel domain-containing protein n=1 Tax=Erwinia sp. Eh17-17 TaxID=3080330 RepID=UPI003209184B